MFVAVSVVWYFYPFIKFDDVIMCFSTFFARGVKITWSRGIHNSKFDLTLLLKFFVTIILFLNILFQIVISE